MEQLVPREAAFDLFQRAWRRVEAILYDASSLPPETPVPHLDWSVGDLALHLVQAAEIAGQLQDGTPSPYTDMHQIAEVNQRLLQEQQDRNLSALVGEFSSAMARMEERFAAMPDEARVPFHAGMSFSPPQAMAMISSELLVHGWDLARVTGDRWEVDPADGRLIVYTVATVIPRMLDRNAAEGFVATYELRIRGGSCFRLHFEDGELAVSEVAPGGVADCRISADPGTFLLMGYGRGSQIAPILTGKVVAWGRKPWLAARFTSLVKSP